MNVYPCQACGAAVVDIQQHTMFHDGLIDLTRAIVAPEATNEEWAAIQVQGQAWSILRHEQLIIEAAARAAELQETQRLKEDNDDS